MTSVFVYLVLTLPWATPSEVYVQTGPSVQAYDAVEVEVNPLELTWSPSEGFGVQSRLQVSSLGERQWK